MTAPKKTPFITKRLAVQLAEQYGTPAFIYREDLLRKQFQEIQAAFSWNKGFREFFPVRELNNPALLRVIHGFGCGVVCTNEVELRLAKMAGIPGKDILFETWNPSGQDWRCAISSGAVIILNHTQQLEDLPSQDYQNDVIGLRLSTNDLSCALGCPPSKVLSKLGMPEDELLLTAHRAMQRGFRGIGLYMSASEYTCNKGALAMMAKHLLTTARKIQTQLGIRIDWCNIGGNVMWTPEPQFTTIAQEAEAVRKTWENFREFGNVPVYVELGEYLAAPAGVLMTRVGWIKQNKTTFTAVDSSCSHLRKAVNKGKNFYLSKVDTRSDPILESVHIAGALVDPQDVLHGIQVLPPVRTGDLILIHHVGANGRTMSCNYNGTLRCPEILLGEDGPRLIARRETFEDYIACLQGDNQQ